MFNFNNLIHNQIVRRLEWELQENNFFPAKHLYNKLEPVWPSIVFCLYVVYQSIFCFLHIYNRLCPQRPLGTLEGKKGGCRPFPLHFGFKKKKQNYFLLRGVYFGTGTISLGRVEEFLLLVLYFFCVNLNRIYNNSLSNLFFFSNNLKMLWTMRSLFNIK